MTQKAKYLAEIDRLPEEIAEAIITTIRELSALDKLVWWGRWQAGMTLGQIAERVDLSIEGVRQRLQAINRDIRQRYEDTNPLPEQYSVSADSDVIMEETRNGK